MSRKVPPGMVFHSSLNETFSQLNHLCSAVGGGGRGGQPSGGGGRASVQSAAEKWAEQSCIGGAARDVHSLLCKH